MTHRIAHGSIAALLLIPFIASPIAAQQDPKSVTARGIVVDAATDEPVAGAYVGILDSRIGTATNARGEFVLNDVPHGAMIEITQLGYTNVVRQVESNEPLRIAISANPIVMEGLTAVADRLANRWRASGVAARRYTADQIIMAPVSNAHDFAYMRAALGRCPWGGDCIWRRGRWYAPSIYVDEMPYGSNAFALLSIPAHEIHLFAVVGGTSIHVFTKHFVERIALGHRMMPTRW